MALHDRIAHGQVKYGVTVSEEEMHPWHGAAKGEVIRNFIERQQDCSDEQQRAAVEVRFQPGAPCVNLWLFV